MCIMYNTYINKAYVLTSLMPLNNTHLSIKLDKIIHVRKTQYSQQMLALRGKLVCVRAQGNTLCLSTFTNALQQGHTIYCKCAKVLFPNINFTHLVHLGATIYYNFVQELNEVQNFLNFNYYFLSP